MARKTEEVGAAFLVVRMVLWGIALLGSATALAILIIIDTLTRDLTWRVLLFVSGLGAFVSVVMLVRSFKLAFYDPTVEMLDEVLEAQKAPPEPPAL